jgi:hypothetical protein
MNYHNFASRLSIQRLPSAISTKEVPKPEPKKARRTPRRRFALATALAILCFGVLGAEAGAKTDGGRRVSPPATWSVNVPTFLVTLTGLGVAILRIPALWRRDLDC